MKCEHFQFDHEQRCVACRRGGVSALRLEQEDNYQLRRQLAEARKLLSKVLADDEWLAAPEWQDACNKFLQAPAGGEG